MEENNNLKKIQEAIESLPENFSILEEQIDIELQSEYFEYTKNNSSIDKITDFEAIKSKLNNPDTDIDTKKRLLVQLAEQDEVEAFRIIEQFHKTSQGTLHNWAVLALQESRMILQSSLLDEQQVFISTGLGGKDQNIRYFIVLMNRNLEEPFTETQQKIIKNEFSFFIQKEEGELEEMEFTDGFASGLFLFPLKKNLQDIFRSFIEECNQYGDFLREDVIITNVKKLNIQEIKNFIIENTSNDKEN